MPDRRSSTIAFFPEAAYGPALNSVAIAQAVTRLGHKAVFLSDPGFVDVYRGYGFESYPVNLSEPMPPEEVGRMGQIRKVAEATKKAMADAGLTDTKDVHLVMVKVPGLTTASIKDSESRGKTVVSHDLTFGPEGAGSYANDAAALGVAMALGEVPESALSDEVVRR